MLRSDAAMIAAVLPVAASIWVCARRPGSATLSLLRNRPGAVLFLAGVLLPNLPALAAYVADIGLPPRPLPILAYFLIAVLAGRAHWLATLALYLAVLIYDVISTIAGMFGLSTSELAAALSFARELKLLEAPLYAAMPLALLGASALTLWLLVSQREALARSRLVLSAAVLLGLIVSERGFAITPNLARVVAPDSAIASATEESGFHTALHAPGAGRDALLVVVEALGMFRNPAHQRLLEVPFARADLQARYTLSTGTIPYAGSTTAAEMRELCQSREEYQSLLIGPRGDCLPASLAARGYRATAIHAYAGGFFERTQWYPHLGFSQSLFWENLAPELNRLCGGVFLGVCDTDIGARILPQLLLDQPERQFVYWLTLNTHVPVHPRDGSPRFDCAGTEGGPLGHVEVCAMTQIWLDTLDTIANLAVARRDKPLEILVVGDHAPPLWSRAGKALFRPGVVPWFRLTPRS